MKIVHVCRQFWPGVGGLEEFVDKLSREQVAVGHAVRVVTLNRIFNDPANQILADHEMHGAVEVRRVPFRGSHRYPVAPGVLKHLDDADLVHVHGVDFLSDYLAATTWLHRKPLVLSTHGGFFHTAYARIAKKVFFATVTRTALTRYRAVIASSLQDEALFRTVAPHRVVTIEDGVDVDKFAGRASGDAKRMIYFGRWAPNKNINRIITWLAAVRRIDPDWRLTIAGKPMGVTQAELEAAAQRSGVADAIVFHASPTNEALGDLISQCSAYVCASSYEGFGMAAVEAASAGLFPVLSRIPAFERTVDRLGFGHLTNFDTDAGEIRAVLRALDRSPDPASSSRNALASFGWSITARRFEAAYRSVLGVDRRRIGPVEVMVLTRDEALASVHGVIDAGRGGVVAFCNAHTVNVARHSPGLLRCMDRALVLNDGAGVTVASRMLYAAPFPANLNGTDFIPALLASRERPTRIFVLGGAPGVAERAASALAKRFAQVRIVGTEHGFTAREDENAVVTRIRRAAPDIVLVGMGQPLQELWADRHRDELDAVLICVGAFLDFTAGEVARAPGWMRRVPAEWIYRLAIEPRRMWRRYLIGNVTFLGGVLVQKVTGQLGVAEHLRKTIPHVEAMDQTDLPQKDVESQQAA